MDLFSVSQRGVEGWAMWGTIGDTLGGLANAVTMLFVILGFFWARSEAKRWRSQHAEEVRADAARVVYRAAHELLTETRLLRAASGFMGDDAKLKQGKVRIDELTIRLRGSIADARLMFGELAEPVLTRLFASTDKAIKYGDRRDRPDTGDIDKELDEVSSELLRVFRPFATLGVP